jgi:hypothetical protein
LLTIAACSSNDSNETGIEGNNYNRTLLLTNWADNIIIPSYVNYQTKIEVLATNINTFNSVTTEVNLQAVRTSWIEAYKAYQYVALYSFGKSQEIYLKESANTYPTNIAGIEANVNDGGTTWHYYHSLTSKVFRFDYLINGLSTTDALIVTQYTTNANAAKYKKYLTDVTTLKNADSVVTDWNSGYRNSYIANNGTLWEAQ